MKLTMENLENTFAFASHEDAKYVAVLIKMDGFPKNEVIINERENFESKLAYYQKTYDNNLQHKFADGISIVGFAYGYTFGEIWEGLND